MQPVSAESKTFSGSGLDCKFERRISGFVRTRLWMWPREALMTVHSEQMADMIICELLNFLRRQYRVFAAERHFTVVPSTLAVMLIHYGVKDERLKV